uniref:Uncharacterized protein n=1 Tax=Rhizophora mucronata TaxID=61149 RepID=A0A2P2NM10_RHIMU
MHFCNYPLTIVIDIRNKIITPSQRIKIVPNSDNCLVSISANYGIVIFCASQLLQRRRAKL